MIVPQLNLKLACTFIGLSIFAGISASLLQAKIEDSALAYFSDSMRDAAVFETVHVHDRAYQISDGNVYDEKHVPVSDEKIELAALQLAYAKTLARRSPMMALAGADLSRLDVEIKSLDDLQLSLSELQKTERDKTLVRDSLYPIAYLSAIHDTEVARNHFLDTGSAEDLASYDRALGNSITEYRRDLDAFRQAFEKSVPTISATLVMGGSVVNRADIQNMLATLAQSITERETRYVKRNLCVRGALSDCDRNSLQLPDLQEMPFHAVSNASLKQASEIMSIYDSVYSQLKFSPRYPLIALSSSSCTSGTAAAPLYTVYASASELDHARKDQALFVGDMRFLTSASQVSNPFYGVFYEHGINYIATPFHTYYLCPTFGRDYAKVYATSAIIRLAHDHPMSQYASPEASGKLRSDEAKLSVSRAIVYESDAVTYLRDSKHLALSQNVPANVRDELTSLILGFNNESYGFNELLEDILHYERADIRVVNKGLAVDHEAPYLFFFRSAILLFYMANNESVTGTSDITYGNPLKEGMKAPYVYYSSIPHTENTILEITHDLQVYRAVHQAPANIPLEKAFSSPEKYLINSDI